MWQNIKKWANDVFGPEVCTAIYRPSITDRQEKKDMKRPPEAPSGRSPKSVPMKKIKRLELEGLDVVEADYYTVNVPVAGNGLFKCEGMESLKAKISELTGLGHTELIVTAYQRVEEYKVSTKIVTVAEPFTSI